MKKMKLFTNLVFALSAFVLISCDKDEKENVPTSPEEFIENPSVINAINESDFPVYSGNTPPALVGTYLSNGVVTDASYLLFETIGIPIRSEFILSKQTTSGKIDFEERVGGIKASGIGGYITGANGKFTIYGESKQSGSEAGLPNDVSITVVFLMSGTKSNNGNLTDVEGISIITEATSRNNVYDLREIKGSWYKWEADFYLKTGNINPFVLQSTTNHSNQSLFKETLQNIMQIK